MLTKACAGSAPGCQSFQASSGYGRGAVWSTVPSRTPPSSPSIGPGAPVHLGPATNTRPDGTATAFQIMPALSAATLSPPGAPAPAEPVATPLDPVGGVAPGGPAQATAPQQSSTAAPNRTAADPIPRPIALPLAPLPSVAAPRYGRDTSYPQGQQLPNGNHAGLRPRLEGAARW
jgi:hypothetical protein